MPKQLGLDSSSRSLERGWRHLDIHRRVRVVRNVGKIHINLAVYGDQGGPVQSVGRSLLSGAPEAKANCRVAWKGMKCLMIC